MAGLGLTTFWLLCVNLLLSFPFLRGCRLQGRRIQLDKLPEDNKGSGSS